MSRTGKTVLILFLLLVLAGGAFFAYTRFGPPNERLEALLPRVYSGGATVQKGPSPSAAVQESGPAQGEGETPGIAIFFTVVHADGSRKDFSIPTRATTLRGALEQEGLIAGVEADWGLYVLTVDGETADQSRQQWWSLTKDGESWPYGVDSTPISGGERFAFTFVDPWAIAAAQAPGTITITLSVFHGDGSQKDFTITTSETTLRGALEQQGLIDGTEGDYGLYLRTVDGETIHESHHDWWRLSKKGELSEIGVDDILIADGDHYELTFIKGM